MDTMICFCHQYTAGDLVQDVQEHGRSTIMEYIMAESKAGHCNCRENNPKRK